MKKEIAVVTAKCRYQIQEKMECLLKDPYIIILDLEEIVEQLNVKPMELRKSYVEIKNLVEETQLETEFRSACEY